MQEVVVSHSIDAPRHAVEDVLDPESIVEYAGTYSVTDAEENDDTVVVFASANELETTLAFTETDVGYVYQQLEDDGPFAEMYTSVAVSGNQPVNVTVRSCFTFGGRLLAYLTDWLAMGERRTELQRMVIAIETAVDDR